MDVDVEMFYIFVIHYVTYEETEEIRVNP